MKGSAGDQERDERGRAASLAATVGRGVRSGAKRSGEGVRAGMGSLSEWLVDAAPRIPVRDLETLREHFPGLSTEEIADRLVAGAVKGTMTVGAGVGAAAMLPTPPAMPTELAAETIGVAAVEYKLIAELHEVYGQRVPGSAGQRATAYLWAWTERRGINVLKPSSVNAALAGPMKRRLRRQLLRRTARSAPVLIPFMIGASVGAMINRHDTRKLAERIRQDLRAARTP